MSGSRWVTTPSWLFGSLRPFLYSSSVYSCHIFLISSASLESESDVTQSCPTLCNPWTVAYQAHPSMGFSRQEYWSGLPFPSPEDLPDSGIKPGSPALQADALTSKPPGLLLGPCYSVLYCAHLCTKCSLGISNFLKEISSLSHSIDFLFLCIVHSRKFHISPCYSLELCVQLGISFPFDFAFDFSSFLSFM